MRIATVLVSLAAAPALATCAESGLITSLEGPGEGCPEPGAGTTIGGLSGSGADATPSPVRRLVLMGGGPEEDGAARRFAEAAAGGDIVVLRATGSLTSYPDYFSAELSPSPHPASVTTIRTDTPPLADHPSVLCRLDRAEAIWLAGGSQWDYLGRWPQSVHVAIREAGQRGAAMGGTSAGAVSMGEAAFDARNGTVTSPEALGDRAGVSVSVGPSGRPQPELRNMIGDSHFTERSREGRLLAFLGRLLAEDRSGSFVGIGIDEGAALEIEDDSYRVSSVRGGAVWMYEATGPAVVQSGRPLSLDGIRRVRLADGVEGLAHSSDLGNAALHMVNEGDIGQFRILSIDAQRRRIRLTPVEIYPPPEEDYAEPEVEGALAAVAESPDAVDAEVFDDVDVAVDEDADDADAAIATESDDVDATIEASDETKSGS